MREWLARYIMLCHSARRAASARVLQAAAAASDASWPLSAWRPACEQCALLQHAALGAAGCAASSRELQRGGTPWWTLRHFSVRARLSCFGLSSAPGKALCSPQPLSGRAPLQRVTEACMPTNLCTAFVPHTWPERYCACTCASMLLCVCTMCSWPLAYRSKCFSV